MVKKVRDDAAPAPRLILVTGGAGLVGRMYLSRPARPGVSYRVLDPAALPAELAGREDITQVLGGVDDPALIAAAMEGVTDVLHLGALSVENTWEAILEVNVTGTRNLLQAAAENGVRRFVFASSNHAVGFYTAADATGEFDDGYGRLRDDAPARPDTYYGFSKAAGEELLRLYAERGLLTGVAIRIGHCYEAPLMGARLPLWLSPRDGVGLIDAALENPLRQTYTVVWGVSNNTRAWTSQAGAAALGYTLKDDSEIFAERFPEETAVDPAFPMGAHFLTAPLGQKMPPST